MEKNVSYKKDSKGYTPKGKAESLVMFSNLMDFCEDEGFGRMTDDMVYSCAFMCAHETMESHRKGTPKYKYWDKVCYYITQLKKHKTWKET